ncbi:MAG TPA: hypothetical protein VI197_29475 [Polyangiaceae bacterium]
MTQPRDIGSAFLRFVHEALGSLAAPTMRDTVIGAALRMASNDERPNTPAGFERFVRGPLRAAMLDAFGAEVTDSVSVELEHVVMLSSRPSGPGLAVSHTPPIPRSSGVPSSSRRSADAGPVPPHSGSRLRPLQESTEHEAASQRPMSQAYTRGTARALGMPLESDAPPPPKVFVASQSLTFVKGLEHFLEPPAARAEDVISLLAALNELKDTAAVIVLDCRRPSIRPMALAILADELPATVQVMLWGADVTLRHQLEQLSPGVARWLSCDQDDDLQAVADKCSAFVG